MKLAPTDLDRQAAELFAAAPRMRAWFAEPGADARACTVLDVSTMPGEWDPGKPRLWVAWEALAGACGWVRAEWLTALDTDDGPTRGAMMAQVEAAAQPRLDAERYVEDLHLVLVSRWKDCKRTGWRVVDDAGGCAFVGPLAETRGAALVAAKRALAAPETA